MRHSHQKVKVHNRDEYITPLQAERLVYRGAASYMDPERTVLRYLEDYEQMRLKSEIYQASDNLQFVWQVDSERGGVYKGEWIPKDTQKKYGGVGPQDSSMQFVGTIWNEETIA